MAPHLAISQMSALSLIGPMPQFSAFSTGATDHFQRLLSACKIKDNGQSLIAFDIYHYLVPSHLAALMPCGCPLFWLCVATVTLLMLSLEYLFSCHPTIRFYLFLSYSAGLLQDTGCDPLATEGVFWNLEMMSWLGDPRIPESYLEPMSPILSRELYTQITMSNKKQIPSLLSELWKMRLQHLTFLYFLCPYANHIILMNR